MTVREPNIYARFYEKDGRRLVAIGIKGTRDEVVEFALPHHALRFPEEFAAFEKGLGEPEAKGTSLEEIPGVSPEKAAGLRLMKIHSVEELASVGDNVLVGLGLGAHALRRSAQLLLQARKAEALEAALMQKTVHKSKSRKGRA